MSFWENRKIKKTRKDHRCEYCGAKIPAGSSCENNVGTYEGDFNHYYLCERCLVFMDMYRDNSESELGNFVDDVYNSDLLGCPGCGKNNHREYEWSGNTQSVNLKCDNCEHEWSVDLSLEALQGRKAG